MKEAEKEQAEMLKMQEAINAVATLLTKEQDNFS